MKLKAITGIALTMLLLAVVSPIDVSVGVVDFDGGSGGFVAQSGVDWWPMFRHDLNHTGYSTSTAPNTNNTIWKYTTYSDHSSPAVSGGKVYVGSYSSNPPFDYPKVYCLNATTGAHIWNYTTRSGSYGVYSCPAVADGGVYVGSFDDGKVYCLNATTGAHIWNYTTGNWVTSSPAVSDGKVYVGSWDYKVYCLNATTGAHIWSCTTYSDHSSPAVADGKVYIGSSIYPKVYCLNATTGAYIWSYPTSDEVNSSPAVADGRVYVGSDDYLVYCLNATTGVLIWLYLTPGCVSSSPAVADDKVYVGSEGRKVYCLNATTGAHIWNYTAGGLFGVWSSPAVADGKVYVGSMDSIVNFYCLNASTGAHIWSYKTGGYVSSSPAVADGKVFVGSYDGKVYAFGPDTTPPNITDVSQFPFKNNVLPADEVEVNATVTDDLSGVKQVTLNYTNGNGTWIIVDMTSLEGNVWGVTIPKFPYCTDVTYAIIAEDNANNTITTGEMGYEYQYHVIPEFPSFIILSLFMLFTLIAVTLAKKIRCKVAKTT